VEAGQGNGVGSSAKTPRNEPAKMAWLALPVASIRVRYGFVNRARLFVFNNIVASYPQIRRFYVSSSLLSPRTRWKKIGGRSC
jgi:hypothetical protein